MNTYPIEITFPDIGSHASGNAGVPYVHTFDSGIAGPHVMINALTHGNEVCGAKSMDFRFAGDYTGLEVFPEAGSVIGWSEGEPVKTPYDDCVLVMPSLRQLRPGVTVVRLGKIERRISAV